MELKCFLCNQPATVESDKTDLGMCDECFDRSEFWTYDECYAGWRKVETVDTESNEN